MVENTANKNRKEVPKSVVPKKKENETEAAHAGRQEQQNQKRKLAAQELVKELRGLRGNFKEAVTQFHLQVDSLMLEVIEHLEATKSANPAWKLPHAADSRWYAEKLGSLSLKPKKGRMKDLEKISRLTNKLGGWLNLQS